MILDIRNKQVLAAQYVQAVIKGNTQRADELRAILKSEETK